MHGVIARPDFVIDIDAGKRTPSLRAFHEFFPGMSIEGEGYARPSFSASGVRLGPAKLYCVTASCVSERRVPVRPDMLSGLLSLIIPLNGLIEVNESGRNCVIGPGSACLSDAQSNFSLALRSSAVTLTLLVPREMVLRRFPHLRGSSARAFDPDDSDTILLGDLIRRAAPHIPMLDEHQRTNLLSSIIDSFGLPKIHGDEADWRLQKALAFITSHLSEANLNADAVARAQSISRRALDRIFARSLGRPVAAEISSARLRQAAEMLTLPDRLYRSVGDIAHEVGFEHHAHFTRAFVRQYGKSPTAWRREQRSPKAE